MSPILSVPPTSTVTEKGNAFVESPISALGFIPRHCGVLCYTPHCTVFARLDLELSYGGILVFILRCQAG